MTSAERPRELPRELRRELHRVALSSGDLEYADVGSGRPVVLLHGLLLNELFWRSVAEPLTAHARCLTPVLPLGGHRVAMKPHADLSPTGLADVVAEFLEALDLRDAVVVSNDTATAVAQILVTRHPERIGGLVLTSGDAFDHFLPWQFRHLQWAARVPGAARAAGALMRQPRMRASRLGFALLTRRGIPAEISETYVRGLLADKGIRRDLTKVLRGISTSYTNEAARRLSGFTHPALVVWAADDVLFPRHDAERLAEALPDARLEVVPDSRTYLPEDQPERLVELLREFLAAPAAP